MEIGSDAPNIRWKEMRERLSVNTSPRRPTLDPGIAKDEFWQMELGNREFYINE